PRLVIAAARGEARRHEAERGDEKAATRRKEEGARLQPAEEALPCEGEADDPAAEQPAEHTADDAADRHGQPLPRLAEMARHAAEILIAAEEREARDASHEHGGDDEPGDAPLEGARHLLDGEDDAGEGRVEGSRDAGRRPRQHEAAL